MQILHVKINYDRLAGEIGGHPQLFPYLVNLGYDPQSLLCNHQLRFDTLFSIMTATIIIGLTVHVLLFYCLAFALVTRKSPFKLIAHLKSVFLRTFSRASAGKKIRWETLP